MMWWQVLLAALCTQEVVAATAKHFRVRKWPAPLPRRRTTKSRTLTEEERALEDERNGRLSMRMPVTIFPRRQTHPAEAVPDQSRVWISSRPVPKRRRPPLPMSDDPLLRFFSTITQHSDGSDTSRRRLEHMRRPLHDFSTLPPLPPMPEALLGPPYNHMAPGAAETYHLDYDEQPTWNDLPPQNDWTRPSTIENTWTTTAAPLSTFFQPPTSHFLLEKKHGKAPPVRAHFSDLEEPSAESSFLDVKRYMETPLVDNDDSLVSISMEAEVPYGSMMIPTPQVPQYVKEAMEPNRVRYTSHIKYNKATTTTTNAPTRVYVRKKVKPQRLQMVAPPEYAMWKPHDPQFLKGHYQPKFIPHTTTQAPARQRPTHIYAPRRPIIAPAKKKTSPNYTSMLVQSLMGLFFPGRPGGAVVVATTTPRPLVVYEPPSPPTYQKSYYRPITPRPQQQHDMTIHDSTMQFYDAAAAGPISTDNYYYGVETLPEEKINAIVDELDDGDCSIVYAKPLRCPSQLGYFRAGDACYFVSTAVNSTSGLTLLNAAEVCSKLNDYSGQSSGRWHLLAINSEDESEALDELANVIATLTGMAGSIYWVDQVVPTDSGFRYKAPCAGNAFLGSARNHGNIFTDTERQMEPDIGCNVYASGVPTIRQRFATPCQDTSLPFICELALDGNDKDFQVEWNSGVQVPVSFDDSLSTRYGYNRLRPDSLKAHERSPLRPRVIGGASRRKKSAYGVNLL